MLDFIEQAAKNFCLHQLGQNCEVKQGVSTKRTLIAYIDIESAKNKRYRAYIASDYPFMQKVSELFLEEEQSNEETLKDMTLETANLIVGSAKVLAEEQQIAFDIQTPFFEKIDAFDCVHDDVRTLKMDDAELTIALKELDA